MKKRIKPAVALLLCSTLLFTGCGGTTEPAAEDTTAAETVEAAAETGEDAAATDEAATDEAATDAAATDEATTDEAATDAADTDEAATDAAAAEEAEPAAAEKVSFGLDQTIESETCGKMSSLYSEVLDDAAVAEGWYYYYTDTDESPVDMTRWELSGDNYTTVEVLFTMENTTAQPQTYGECVTAQMYYRENADAQEICYEGTVFQQNPDQVDKNGTVIMWSTKPVAIEPGQTANVSFRFDIPKEVYDKVYAEAAGEDTGITEICEFGFGDGVTYTVDLAEVLIAASDYESETE